MVLPGSSSPVWDRLSSLSSSGFEESCTSILLFVATSAAVQTPLTRPGHPDRHRPAASAQARPIESGTLDHPIMEGAGISLISV
jgi:hypothetical protein